MSFAMSSLNFWDVLGVPSTRLPIGVTTFAWYVLPPIACYVAAAVSAITPHTRTFRVALWPVITLLAFRATASVDLSFGLPEQSSSNAELIRLMLCITVHSLSWALTKQPLVRRLRPANNTPSTIMDALDLAANFRGVGWDWSRGLHVPRNDARPTNRIVFAAYTFVSAIVHNVLASIFYRALNTFITRPSPPDELDTASAFTIFDTTLPFPIRLLRAHALTALAALAIRSGMQMTYDLVSALAVLLCAQVPAQWPPVFDKPWRASSLADFWGRRWHQSMRHAFIVIAHPLQMAFGRPGGIVGAFVASGLIHSLIFLPLRGKDGRPSSEWWRMLVGFGMMASGILAERAFYKLTGKRVGGIVGRVWTMGWLLLWGTVIVEGFARAGLFYGTSAIDANMPAWVKVGVVRLVVRFDDWLRRCFV